MKIISERQRVTAEQHNLFFAWIKNGEIDYGHGFGFDCFKDGTIILPMQEGAWGSYQFCLNNPGQVAPAGVQTYVNSYTEPAVLECSCGGHVPLHGFTNTCDDCEADYNMSGQLLAPRMQWGEETGEHWSDCL